MEYFGLGFALEIVIQARMISIVTQSCNQECEHFKMTHQLGSATIRQEVEHGLCYIESMEEIVEGNLAVLGTELSEETEDKQVFVVVRTYRYNVTSGILNVCTISKW